MTGTTHAKKTVDSTTQVNQMKEKENTQQQLSAPHVPLARLFFTEDVEMTSLLGEI